MKNVRDFTEFVTEAKINPKKQFGMTTQVNDSIKSLCESTLCKEAKSYHEDDDPSHTYEGYVGICSDHLKKCMGSYK